MIDFESADIVKISGSTRHDVEMLILPKIWTWKKKFKLILVILKQTNKGDKRDEK